MSTAVKLSAELVTSARRESEVWSRSMTQQIEHWARIGRAIEHGGAIEHARIRAALSAELAYDRLSSEERAAVLGELGKRVVRPKGDAELSRRLLAAGIPVSVLDGRGRVRTVSGKGSRRSGGRSKHSR